MYFLALFLSFWVLTKSATAIYQVLFIPLFFVLIIELYAKTTALKTPLPKLIYCTALVYLCVGIVGNLQIITQNNTNYLPNRYALLKPIISTQKVGLVPLTFFFNEYTHYDRLLCQTNFELQMRYKNVKKPTQNMFFEWAKQNKVDFVVLDYLNNNADYYPIKDTPNLKSYNIIYSSNQFAVYQANEN